MATGDLVLERDDPAELLGEARPLLLQADAVIGHLEVPHTDASTVMSSDVAAQPKPLRRLWMRSPMRASASSLSPETTCSTSGRRASQTPAGTAGTEACSQPG
ncbi:hypothetical protein [Nesterenkonia pannonica]|uniref:hypothetical protein n=1 Tax=Nesterenkonia pannonica TaxID=1548602 RepID=UPI002164BA85|nr:hypothetical protein [Nesterenkonia pannonica]